MKTTVYKNASIVTGLSVLERGLGFLYRIVLSRLIGGEGLGLYQVALSLFSLFLTLATGGIPITLSRMIAKAKAENDPQAEKRAVSAGLVLSLLVALPCALLVWLLGDKMPFLFSDSRALSVLKILLVGLCFSSIYAVLRGYLWGNKRFLASSLLELSEETVMVIAGVFLLSGVPSPAVGATRAAWAVVISYALAALFSAIVFFAVGGRFAPPKAALKSVFNATLPITFVRGGGAIVGSAIAVLLPAMLLRAGVDSTDAIRQFGVVSGMVMPVLMIPATLIGSLALVLVPELSESYYKGDTAKLRRNISKGLRFSLLVACALTPFFFVLGEDLGKIAFSSALAGEMIRKSCPILIPMSLAMISSSMLNSLGFEKQTFLFYYLGAAALLLCVLFLPPLCGIYAYVIGLGASYTITALCNLLLLYKKCPIFEKSKGQVCVEFIFPALICILPVSILGQLCMGLFVRFLGEIPCVICSALVMGLGALLSLPLAKSRFSKK